MILQCHYGKNILMFFKLIIILIRYEDVVSNFEKTIKDLLKFLNVPWSDNVKNFIKLLKKEE